MNAGGQPQEESLPPTCFIELQAWEQTFEPGLPTPEEAADPYLVEGFQELRGAQRTTTYVATHELYEPRRRRPNMMRWSDW